MPRKLGDRPKVVPTGCTNLALLGQFVEIKDDVVFTVETLWGCFSITKIK